MDTQGRIPLDAKVLHNSGNTVVATTDRMDDKTRAAIKRTGSKLWGLPNKDNRVCLYSTLKRLGEKKIDSVLIEGGMY